MADKANPKINVYGLGTRGVNLTKSPLHLEDNELTQAQNAEPSLDEREGGLRKRGGLAVMTSALNGGASILGLCNLPLPTTYVKTMYAALQTAGANTWLKSTDGTTWTTATSPSRAASTAPGTSGVIGIAVNYYNNRILGFKNKIIFPGNDYIVYNNASYTDPPIRQWDGVQDAELIRVPVGPSGTAGSSPYLITDMIAVDGVLYVSLWEPGGAAPNVVGRVLAIDLTRGLVSQVGNCFGNGTSDVAGGMPWSICSYRGQLWAGLHGIGGASAGKIVRINPSITTGASNVWTSDVTGLQGYPISLCKFRGELYAGTQGDALEQALVVRRSASAGTWSTSDTGSGSTTGIKYYAGLIVFNSLLFAIYHHTFDDTILIRKFDGTSWSTDLDVSTLTLAGTPDRGAAYVGQGVIFNDALYLAFSSSGVAVSDGFILKRTTAGTWSIATDGKNIRGFLSTLVERS